MFNHAIFDKGKIKPNTLALYEFDGSKVRDLSQNRFDLTVNGTVPLAASPKQGSQACGPFTAGYLNFPSGIMSRFTSLSTYTIQFYGMMAAGVSNNYVFSANDGNQIAIIFPTTVDGDIYFRQAAIGLGLKYTVPGGAGGINNQWHHWAFVSKTNGREIWMDGVRVASDGTSNAFGTVPTIANIGRFHSVGTTSTLMIDQYRVSNVSLSHFPTVD